MCPNPAKQPAPRQQATPPGTRIRTERGQRAERALTDAVLELIDEDGFATLSVEKIAARAKVGKPTIYRRWANKEQLVAHVLGNLDPPEPIDPGEDLRLALVGILDNLRRRITDTRTGRIWKRLIGEPDSYADVLALYDEQFLAPRRRAIADLLTHHIHDGTLRADLDVTAAVDALTGSVLGAFVSPSNITSRPPIATIVDLLIDGMAAHGDEPVA